MPKEIIDAERHRRTTRKNAISVKTICVRMLCLCKADSMRDADTTLASAALAQKAAEQSYPKHTIIIEANPNIDARLSNKNINN